jgi:bacteriorhodopsin
MQGHKSGASCNDNKCKVYVQVCFVILCELLSILCFIRSSHSNFDKIFFLCLKFVPCFACNHYFSYSKFLNISS